jgi:hypothetical protein
MTVQPILHSACSANTVHGALSSPLKNQGITNTFRSGGNNAGKQASSTNRTDLWP